MDLIQSYFSCRNPLRKVCVRRSFFSSSLSWGIRIRTGGSQGRSLQHVKISLHHHFPTQSFLSPKSTLRGPVLEISAKPQSPPLLPNPQRARGKSLHTGDEWCLLAVRSYLQHGAQESWAELGAPGCCCLPVGASISSWECCPAGGQAEGWQSPSRARSWALVGQQQHWDAQTRPPSRQGLHSSHKLGRTSGHWHWPASTCTPSSSTAPITRVPRFLTNSTGEKAILGLQWNHSDVCYLLHPSTPAQHCHSCSSPGLNLPQTTGRKEPKGPVIHPEVLLKS